MLVYLTFNVNALLCFVFYLQGWIDVVESLHDEKVCESKTLNHLLDARLVSLVLKLYHVRFITLHAHSTQNKDEEVNGGGLTN